MDLKKYYNEKNILFQKKLIFDDKYEFLGMYSKDMKNEAKLNKDDYTFLNEDHKYYDEWMIHAYMLSYIKDLDLLYDYVLKFIPHITNWSICDCFVSSIKQVKKDKARYFKLINEYVSSKKTYYARFSYVMLKAYYIDSNIDFIFKVLDKYILDDYYINMAKAWLLADCYIKNKEKTKEYLLKSKLDSFTFNKAISKMCDSFRVSNDEKNELKKLKK